MTLHPFQKNMWSARQVLKTYGSDAKVYPCDTIVEAYFLSYWLERLRLFREYRDEIECAYEQLSILPLIISNEIARIQKVHNYKLEGDDVMQFLKSTAVELSKFMEENGPDYECWPETDRGSLAPCFKEHHIYEFYEEYMGYMRLGMETFLKLIPRMKRLFESARLSGTFYWDNHDVQFLNQFEAAIEELTQQHMSKITIIDVNAQEKAS